MIHTSIIAVLRPFREWILRGESIPHRHNGHIARISIKQQHAISRSLVSELCTDQPSRNLRSQNISYNPTPTMNVHNNALALLAFFCSLSRRREEEPTGDISTSITGRNFDVETLGEDFRRREHGLTPPAHFSILCSADLNILLKLSKSKLKSDDQ
jgi:hypothetical protein